MSSLHSKQKEIDVLIEKGNFPELYSLINGSKTDILYLIESCFHLNKFSEAKELFYSINIEDLDQKEIQNYKYLEVTILALEEKFEKSIELGNQIIKKFQYDLRKRVTLLIKICSCYRKLGKLKIAIDSLRSIEQEITPLSDYYQAEFFNALGLALKANGETKRSLTFFNKTLELYMAIKDETGIARAYNNQATTYNDIGELDKALEMYLHSLDIQAKTSNTLDLAILYNNVAVIYQKKGLLSKSIEYYEYGLELVQKEGNLTYEAIFQSNLGGIECDKGNLQKSMLHLERAQEMFKTLNQQQHLASTYSLMSETYFEIGEYEKAKRVMFESLTIKKDLNNKLEILLSIYSFYWNIYAFNEIFDKDILSFLSLIPDEPYESKNIGIYVKLIKSILEMKDGHYLKAREILSSVKNDEGIEFNHKIMLLKSLAITELELLKNDISEKNFSNFINILDEIIAVSSKNNLVTSQADIILTQARFECLLLQFDKALETLNTGLELAKKAELHKHIRFFTKEIALINEKMKDVAVFTKINSEIDLEELKNYLFSIRQMINRE